MSDNQNDFDDLAVQEKLEEQYQQLSENLQQQQKYPVSQSQFKMGNIIFDLNLPLADIQKYQGQNYKRLKRAESVESQIVGKKNAVQNFINQLKWQYKEKYQLQMVEAQYLRFVKKSLDKKVNLSNRRLFMIYRLYQDEEQWEGKKEIREQKKMIRLYWSQLDSWQCKKIQRNTILTKFFNLVFKIRFQNLTYLDISRNNITSIQGLCYAEIPNLQMLQIFGNRITNFNCLHKCKFKNLSTLTFYNNPILEINRFTYGQLERLEKLQIDGWLYQDNNYNDQSEQYVSSKAKKFSRDILQNINFIYKLPSFHRIRSLQIEDESRILNRRQFILLVKQFGNKLKLKIDENKNKQYIDHYLRMVLGS